MLSIVYGTCFLLSTARAQVFDPFPIKDVLASLIAAYSARHHNGGRTRVDGAPRLLDKIRQGATACFLVLSTGHLPLLFFEVVAPVSDHSVNLRSATREKLHIPMNIFL